MNVFKLFLTFLKIGTMTFGSGYVMVTIVEKEFVDKRGLISRQEYLKYLTLATSFPGPIVINIASLIGHQQFGMKGLIACFLGASLPSFFILLIIAMSFTYIVDYPAVIAIFKGFRPAIIGLILVPVIKFAKDVTRWEYPVIAALAGLMLFNILSPIYAIVGGIIVGLAISFLNIDSLFNKKQ